MAGPVRPIFPFTALVGQERMKLGLLLNAINPKIGGVLVRGEKGTAKSTAARALAALLPEEPTIAPSAATPGVRRTGATRAGSGANATSIPSPDTFRWSSCR